MYHIRMAKRKKRLDVNEIAAEVVRFATEQPKDSQPKNPAAQALGRLGGKKGGKARAEKLTPEARRAIALKAAKARWKHPPS